MGEQHGDVVSIGTKRCQSFGGLDERLHESGDVEEDEEVGR